MERKPGSSKFVTDTASWIQATSVLVLFHLQLAAPLSWTNMADPSFAIIYAWLSEKEGRMAHSFCLGALSEFAQTTSLWQEFSLRSYPKEIWEM